ITLQVLIDLLLWVAGHLGGFDVAFLDVVLSWKNPAYLTALFFLAWWLLAPFVEACTYLLHVDTRVRYEGLDLWYRVQRLFPVKDHTRASAILLALAALVVLAPGARADDPR